MQKKYNLDKMLEEIKEDKKVFEEKENYWASQDEIQDMIKKIRKQKEIEK